METIRNMMYYLTNDIDININIDENIDTSSLNTFDDMMEYINRITDNMNNTNNSIDMNEYMIYYNALCEILDDNLDSLLDDIIRDQQNYDDVINTLSNIVIHNNYGQICLENARLVNTVNILPQIITMFNTKDITVIKGNGLKFINNILRDSGYKNDTSIYTQAMLDFPRQEIMVNSKVMNSFDEFIVSLAIRNDYSNVRINNRFISFITLAMMLICQSTLFTSYHSLYAKLEDIKYDINVNALNNTKSKYSADILNYFILDTPIRNTFNIIIDKDNFGLVVSSHYRMYDVTNEKTVYNIDVDYYYNYNEMDSATVYRFSLE